MIGLIIAGSVTIYVPKLIGFSFAGWANPNYFVVGLTLFLMFFCVDDWLWWGGGSRALSSGNND